MAFLAIMATAVLLSQAPPSPRAATPGLKISDIYAVTLRLYREVGAGKKEFETSDEFAARVRVALNVVGVEHLFRVPSAPEYDADSSNIIFNLGAFAEESFASCPGVERNQFQQVIIDRTTPLPANRNPVVPAFISSGIVVGPDSEFSIHARSEIANPSFAILPMERERAKVQMKHLDAYLRGDLTGDFCSALVRTPHSNPPAFFVAHPVVNVKQIVFIDRSSGAIVGSTTETFEKKKLLY